MDLIQTLARELGESAQHVEDVVRLLDEGNTSDRWPFCGRTPVVPYPIRGEE